MNINYTLFDKKKLHYNLIMVKDTLRVLHNLMLTDIIDIIIEKSNKASIFKFYNKSIGAESRG